MWLNEKEGEIIAPFKEIIESNEDKKWLFEFENGTTLIVRLDGEYESDNGLDEDEEGYEEYFAMLFAVLEVIKDDTNIHFEGELIEISYQNLPARYVIID